MVADYLDQFRDIPLIDVRTPSEYAQGHIPGALNIPLFSDEERARVGTVYKKQSRQEAMDLGYRYAEKKFDWYLSKAAKVAPRRRAVVHCWRGGMRSGSFGKHLEKHGFREVYVLEGGYKAFRQYALESFRRPDTLYILGGYTGSGKTHILHVLAKRGAQVIDLEAIACHRGSAFGAIGQSAQPTNEHFTNLLFWAWKELDMTKPVWLEDESIHIGHVFIPEILFARMRRSPLFFLDIPREQRARLLVEEYTGIDKALLSDSVRKISKRLGGQRTKDALDAIEREDYLTAALFTLHYYDKYYRKGLQQRDVGKVSVIDSPTADAEKNASLLFSRLEADE